MFRVACCLLLLSSAGVARAQDAHTSDRTMGGRGAQTVVRMDAQRAAEDLGVACGVRDAAFLGRDPDGRPAWEVACAAGDGHVVVGGDRSIDCLSLSTGPTRCRLPANRDPASAVARLAAQAGVTCAVAGGRLVGRSPDDGWIYEVGCEAGQGVWIERRGPSWTVTPCDRVVAISGECRFTSEAEIEDALIARVAQVCPARRARWMGAEATGDWYEAACDDGRRLVARITSDGTVTEALPCDEAGAIGTGCRLED